MNAHVANAGSIARTRGWTTLVLMVGERPAREPSGGAWVPPRAHGHQLICVNK